MNDQILENYQIRKTNKEKTEFIGYLKERLSVSGYDSERDVTIEEKWKGIFLTRNIIVGNPDKAKVLLAAHYDTCALLPFPNLMAPTSPLLFVVYQLFLLVMIFLVATIPAVITGRFTKDPMIIYYVFELSLILFLVQVMFGFKNRHAANDNTSGVITVLEIARTMPEMHRDKVCFVLFDLEEVGLFGSAAYRQKHKKQSNDQIVLNLDCVGDGDEIVFFPRKKLCKDEQKLRHLCSCVGRYGKKSIAVKNKGFRIYPSDQTQFPYGVGIAAFHRKKWVGLYCARIHTPKDTVLELTNVNILRAAITSLISTDAA
jgi:hypothetical protein